ncbi:alpha-L-arabinofuranosidase [Paenibacillus castaneae]|nr:alpha-L-arabinofuranosidase [Paenibacillus castaneae]
MNESAIFKSDWLFYWIGEDNSFGTYEFLDLCEQIDCSPYIAANVGSGTPREVSEWIEYMTFSGESPMANWRRQNSRDEPWKIEFFGIGNENWGCGGNMRPEYYADIYKRFETLMRLSGKNMNGLSLHYYTMPKYYETEPYPWENKGPAVGFDKGNYYRTLRRGLY